MALDQANPLQQAVVLIKVGIGARGRLVFRHRLEPNFIFPIVGSTYFDQTWSPPLSRAPSPRGNCLRDRRAHLFRVETASAIVPRIFSGCPDSPSSRRRTLHFSACLRSANLTKRPPCFRIFLS